MTEEEVKRLKPGDQVFWNDPCIEMDCSRLITIQSIDTSHPDVVSISEKGGGHLECYAQELD